MLPQPRDICHPASSIPLIRWLQAKGLLGIALYQSTKRLAWLQGFGGGMYAFLQQPKQCIPINI